MNDTPTTDNEAEATAMETSPPKRARGRRRRRRVPKRLYIVITRDPGDHSDYGHSHVIDDDNDDGAQRAQNMAREMCALDYEAVIIAIPVPRKGWKDYRTDADRAKQRLRRPYTHGAAGETNQAGS